MNETRGAQNHRSAGQARIVEQTPKATDQRDKAEQTLTIIVPQISKAVVKEPQPHERNQARLAEQVVAMPVPQITAEIAHAFQPVPQERNQARRRVERCQRVATIPPSRQKTKVAV